MLEILATTVPLVAIALIVVLCRSCIAGATMILTMAAAKAWFVEMPGIELGVMLYPGDGVALLLALAASLRIMIRGAIPVPLSALIFTAMLMLSFLSGLSEFGQSAGVDFRVLFTFIAGLFYFSTFDIDSVLVERLVRAWIVASCVLMLIAWFVWFADVAGLAMAKKWIDADPTGVKFRVLNSGITYMIGVGAVALLHLVMNRQVSARWWPLFLALIGTVLVLQHRSVWAATLVSGACVVLLAHRGRARMLWFAGAVALVSIALIPFFSQRLSGVSESVALQAQRATDIKKGTSGGRVLAWEQLLRDWQKLGLGRQLIGRPFGSSYGGLTNVPHNCYLQVMYRTGYVGLLAMLAMYGSTVLRLLRRRQVTATQENGTATILLALTIGQLTFFIPYAFTAEMGLLFGTAIAHVRWRLPRQSSAEAQFDHSHELQAGMNPGMHHFQLISIPQKNRLPDHN